jgi:Leucine-rich repeat (LRR) protein
MKALPASRGPTRTARERRACYPMGKQKLFSRGAHRLTATARAALAFAAASACIEPSWLYDRSVTPSHAAAESLVGLVLAQNLGEDHLVARTLVSAARVAPVVLLGGIVLASIAIPSWLTFEYRAGENALRKLGASLSDAKSGGLLVELPTQISDDTLIKEGPHLERLDVAHLNLPHSRLTSLEPLKGLTNLSSLALLDAAGITGLEPLKGLTNLRSLDLSYATGVTSLEPLKGLTNLSLLDLRSATGITSLEPLKGLTKLSSLGLRNATGVTSLEPLKGLANLSWLDLSYATGVTSLEPLSGLTRLRSLYLDNATGITSLEPLKGLTELSSLDLRDAIGITSLEPLKGLTNLGWLNLNNATGITSLEPLSGLTSLRSLYLDNAAGITSLEPLKGLRVRIYGASDELLATMN